MTLQQQQQPGVVLGADRSIMPVVSVSGVGIGVATASQMNAVPQPPLSTTVQQLPLPVLFLFTSYLRIQNLAKPCKCIIFHAGHQSNDNK